jgi:hypothetical protein
VNFPDLCDEHHDAAEAGDTARIEALFKDNLKLVSHKKETDLSPLHEAPTKAVRLCKWRQAE